MLQMKARMVFNRQIKLILVLEWTKLEKLIFQKMIVKFFILRFVFWNEMTALWSIYYLLINIIDPWDSQTFQRKCKMTKNQYTLSEGLHMYYKKHNQRLQNL